MSIHKIDWDFLFLFSLNLVIIAWLLHYDYSIWGSTIYINGLYFIGKSIMKTMTTSKRNSQTCSQTHKPTEPTFARIRWKFNISCVRYTVYVCVLRIIWRFHIFCTWNMSFWNQIYAIRGSLAHTMYSQIMLGKAKLGIMHVNDALLKRYTPVEFRDWMRNLSILNVYTKMRPW